jgi:acyl dehydratase
MSSRALQTMFQQPAFQIRVGERLSKRMSLTSGEIAHFAGLCEDMNPLHHDQEFAQQSRYGEIVAAGAHTTSLLIGSSGTYFSGHGRMMVGLEYQYRLLAGVRAGEIDLIWEIVDVQQTRSGKQVVTIEGAVMQEGQIAVEAKGKVLVAEKL